MPIRHVRWTPHGLDRLGDRPDVPRELAEAVVRDPEQVVPDETTPGRLVAHRRVTMSGRLYLIRVFYDPEPDDTAAIVSCYRASRVSRYWREGL
jgi:hypothetical protein